MLYFPKLLILSFAASIYLMYVDVLLLIVFFNGQTCYIDKHSISSLYKKRKVLVLNKKQDWSGLEKGVQITLLMDDSGKIVRNC